MRKHSRKRHLTVNEIGRCNPSIKRNSSKSCLPSAIYSQLSKTKKCKTGEDHCLLDSAMNMPSEKKNKLRTTYLRPRRPSSWESDPDEWLDNFNIQDVMSQYEKACPWFRFLGVFPIDFSVKNPYRKDKEVCLNPEICTIDIHKEYDKGIRAFGAIFNLDPHYKSGSHWVGLYCNLEGLKDDRGQPWCAYFDSYGYDTPPYIARFMRYLYSQDNRLKLMYNARRFQYSTSECGVYSMYFIVCMLNGIQFSKFCKKAIPDSMMLRLRQQFFSK